MKILTVDDDESIRNAVSLMLEEEGFETVRARNGRVALDYLLSVPDTAMPDLILLDFMMPVMNGDEFCKEKKRHLKLSKIPVVMMTAGGNLMRVMDAIETNAEGYLSKPMNVETVIGIIQHFLNIQDEDDLLSEYVDEITLVSGPEVRG